MQGRKVYVRVPWLNNGLSNGLIISIPYELVVKHGIQAGTNIVFEDTESGILLKKLVIE
jgi:hypothetical protein